MSEDLPGDRPTGGPARVRRAVPSGVEHDEEHRRRWLLRTVVGVTVAVALIAGAPWLYARFMARPGPDPLALSTPTASPSAAKPTGPIEVDGTWQIGAGSQGGYRLAEVLSGEQFTVVGRTDQVTGAVVIADGMLTGARVVVDADSISTDEAARDAYFRRALDTSTYPQAVFTLTEPVDVSAVAWSPDAVTLVAIGTLELHGVTRRVTADLQVQRTADGVEVVGEVPVTLTDFDLPAPDLGWVTVQPAGVVEVLLALVRG